MDLERLYEYGLLSFGLDQADRHYDALIDRFSELAQTPHLWQSVDPIRSGYRRNASKRVAVVRMTPFYLHGWTG